MYPQLDPQMILNGSLHHCMLCTMIKEALHGVGLELNEENFSLTLYQMYPNHGLVAMAGSSKGIRGVQFFTLFGESPTLLIAVELCKQIQGSSIVRLCN
jgi:hypothetical protein